MLSENEWKKDPEENQLFFANLTIAATRAWEALSYNELSVPRF